MFIVYLKMLHGNMKNPRKLDMLLVKHKKARVRVSINTFLS